MAKKTCDGRNSNHSTMSAAHRTRQPSQWTIYCLVFAAIIWTLWRFAPSRLDVVPCGISEPEWKTKARAKRRELHSKIPEEWRLTQEAIEEGRQQHVLVGDFFDGLLDPETLRITQMDPVDIVAETTQGNLTAVEVVTAFCKRAAFAHQISPTLLEIGFDLALKQAEELDDYLRTHGKPKGPLHGLPITLKDQFHIKGLETSFAYIGWIGTFEGRKDTGKEKKVESELIREFISLGAVPIAKTTLMMSTWAPETRNNILGYLKNPFNRNLSSGGSSGGEGVIQALRGSAFGVGTDSGGSVSMPASYNGLYSIKPSPGRLSLKDAVGSGKGNLVLGAVAGLMGPSVRTLRLAFKSLMDTKPWLYDPFVLPIPYRTELEVNSSSELVLGILESDGFVAPHPPIVRAMNVTSSALRAKGVKLIEWQPPMHNKSDQLHAILTRGDGCFDAWNAINLSGEHIPREIKGLFPGKKLSDPYPLPLYEDTTLDMIEFRNLYNEYWQSTWNITGTGRPVDAFIMPVSPYAGVIPGKFRYSTYGHIVNVLGYCSAAIPVTYANKTIDILHPGYKPLSKSDDENMHNYDAETHHGAPAGIQVVARGLEEEKLLSISAIVASALAEYQQ